MVATFVSMDAQLSDPIKSLTTRHKCSACFKQFKRKEHLVEHMKISFHSVHQPRCGVCQKHCRSFESVREHLTGPLPKTNCSRIFSDHGCYFCLKVFDSLNSLSKHKETYCPSTPAPLVINSMPCVELQINFLGSANENHSDEGPEAVAMDCEMVGGGSDGTLNICARVCLVDKDENLIFHTYVQPWIPVTNYRYEITGLTEEHLKDGMPLKEVQEKLMEILYDRESIGTLHGGRAKLLVGHGLEHDLDCLRLNYPVQMLRDTAKYLPLMKTNLVSHSLKYLTRTYLGYDIQSGVHDPYEDCVSAMRLYKRIRGLDHHVVGNDTQNITSGFDSWKSKELVKMTPDELYKISRSNYRCWCLDSKKAMEHSN
ncbi:RNase_T domain-containing protein [Cephalotus follicularis]|uniref:RNA exonuclease 4 n=1 Tax=Cephalotus follicularis TaxID=3775 RepID=A0A1Q3CEU5_CEPFO|nr:RNase_T domain-containing protein [Cephalotus follicularis]